MSHDINWAIKKKSPTDRPMIAGGRALLEAPDGLKVGTTVQLFLRGRVVASAVVDFVGGHGSVKKWGKMSVREGEQVCPCNCSVAFWQVPTLSPSFSSFSFSKSKIDPPHENMCLASQLSIDLHAHSLPPC